MVKYYAPAYKCRFEIITFLLNFRKTESVNRSGQPSWLSISLDAALGCKINVFQIRRMMTAHRQTIETHSIGVRNFSSSVPLVTIHPLATPIICR